MTDEREERLLKLTATEGDQVVEMIAPTLDGGKTIQGIRETVLRVDGNFAVMPDYVMVRGVRYVPDNGDA